MKTKDKILQTARSMFNEQGFGNVSLANLADELGIAKGNVWYHFNDKRALLAAINAQYTKISDERQKMLPAHDKVLESYVDFIQAIAWEIREFRFMFRDRADYGQHSEKFEEDLPDIYVRNFAQFRSFFEAMIEQGYLNVTKEDLSDLVYNSVVVLRYNLEFEKEIGRSRKSDKGGVSRSFLQHLSVLKVHMEAEAYDFLCKSFQESSGETFKWAI